MVKPPTAVERDKNQLNGKAHFPRIFLIDSDTGSVEVLAAPKWFR
jgi:hypothetical protein